MITAILAGIFYIADPFLGVIVALVVPSLIALDSDQTYYSLGAVIMLYIAFFFMRKTRIET
jgi:uncharacterized membrane protein YobD (UPF0266 family)